MENKASEQTSGSGIAVIERLLQSGTLEIGEYDAPVSMILFVNFQSEYSKQFHQQYFSRLMTDVVRTGKVRIAVIPVELKKYPESRHLAGLLLCASQQGKGWAMNDVLYKEAPDSAAFKTALTELHIEVAGLETCAKDPTTQTMLSNQQQFVSTQQVNLVPSYALNGKMYTGLPDYADLRGQIEEEVRR